MKRWAEHVNNVLNNPAGINDDVEINEGLFALPTVDEVKKAVK